MNWLSFGMNFTSFNLTLLTSSPIFLVRLRDGLIMESALVEAMRLR